MFDEYEEWVVGEAENIALDYVERYAPPPPPRPIVPLTESTEWGEVFVGWSQPPRPTDVIVSFDPGTSKRDQARAVLYDYYHDDPLRYWSDNEAVKRCFIGGTDPRKEGHDPLLLIAAYENPKHKIWSCKGTGMSWREMDAAVQQAIAHRKKLGPLPKSVYATPTGEPANPIVIYYYDNDKMKRITYPLASVPEALRQNNFRWWAWGNSTQSDDAGKAAGLDDVHTRETSDPKKIALERARPGWTKGAKDNTGSAGDWQSEGPQWDKDVAGTGVVGSITGAILALVSAVLDATGVGAIVGVPLGIATPFIVAAINATDTALHAGDFSAALANLGPALIQASISAAGKGAGAGGINIPPAALKALGGTLSGLAKEAIAGQQKKLDFGEIWSAVSKKAKSYSKIGDDEAEAIATMLGGPGGKGSASGHVFMQGYLAGKFLDMPSLKAVAKLLQPLAVYYDPRIINIALLGMGIGSVSKAQSSSIFSTKGSFAGQIVTGADRARDDLLAFVEALEPRYTSSFGPGRGGHATRGYMEPDQKPYWVSNPRGAQILYSNRSPVPGSFPIPHGAMVDAASHMTNWLMIIPSYNAFVDYKDLSPLDTLYPIPHPSKVSGYGEEYAGEEGPPLDWGPLARGCPRGSWWDPLQQMCRPRQ